MVKYTYHPSGKRASKICPKTGLETHYAYNDAGLLTSLENRRGNTVLSRWTHAYGLDGVQVNKTNKDGATTTYRYNRMGQLVEENDPSWNTIRYQYDRFGNRRNMTVTGAETYETTYQYHPNNWLIKEVKNQRGAVETVIYQYDKNGNQCYRKWERREEKCSARKKAAQLTFAPHKENTVLDLREYDGFGALIRVYRDHVRTDYRYRPDGLRFSKRVDDRGSVITTTHHWDGQHMVMETGGTGQVKARYFRGGGLIAQQMDANIHYYLLDAHGDVVQRVDQDGNASPEYTYDAFGNQRDPITTDPNPFRYCGEYWDAETGEVYLRNRYYSSDVGRFTSQDPARDGLNWYAYCGNNPVAFVDPLGLAGWSIGYINKRLYGNSAGPKKGQKPNWSGLNWALSVSSRESGNQLRRQSAAVVASHGNARFNMYVGGAVSSSVRSNAKATIPEPSQGYKTMGEAAMAWAMAYNPQTLGDGKEWVSALYYKRQDKLYWYTTPISGKYAIDKNGNLVIETDVPSAPKGYRTDGYIHSHPPDGEYTEIYSREDIFRFQNSGFRPSYLVTAGGTMQKLYEERSGFMYLQKRVIHVEMSRGEIPGDENFLHDFIHISTYRTQFPDQYEGENLYWNWRK